jgi:hypothetical protein
VHSERLIGRLVSDTSLTHVACHGEAMLDMSLRATSMASSMASDRPVTGGHGRVGDFFLNQQSETKVARRIRATCRRLMLAIATARIKPTLRARCSGAGEWIRARGYLQKWLVLGVAIGSVAGLGAVVLLEALKLTTHLLTGILGGYTPPAPAGDGGGINTGTSTHAWAIPLVVCLGGLASGLLLRGSRPARRPTAWMHS